MRTMPSWGLLKGKMGIFTGRTAKITGIKGIGFSRIKGGERRLLISLSNNIFLGNGILARGLLYIKHETHSSRAARQSAGDGGRK